ncbi:MAG: helix-turn-helix domain-containing protein [Phyllobacterium sp.]
MDFGEQLREWRSHRRISQLDLAMEAGISSRHLSFLETGRARPSEGMIVRISETLELPLKSRNALFAAAGFAPRYQSAEDRGMSGLPSLIRDTLNLIMQRHAPWPAIAFDANHDIVAANEGFAALGASLGVKLGEGANILGLVLEPGPVRDVVENWHEVASVLLRRARNEARLQGPKGLLAQRIAAYEAEPDLAMLLHFNEGERNPPPVIPVQIRMGETITNWITTLTAFGAAQEVLSEGIFIEQYFPADDATRLIADSLSI